MWNERSSIATSFISKKMSTDSVYYFITVTYKFLMSNAKFNTIKVSMYP